MKNILVVLSSVFMIVAGNMSFCRAEDPSALLKDHALMQTIVDGMLKESLKSGTFGTMLVGDAYLKMTPKTPEQKPLLELAAWMNYLNTHRLLSAVYNNQNIDEQTKNMLGNYMQSLMTTMYTIGEKQFGWDNTYTDKVYAYCLELINTRITQLEETVFVATGRSNESAKTTGKPFPVVASPNRFNDMIMQCGETLMQANEASAMREAFDACFEKNGYSYTATLQVLAEQGFTPVDAQNILGLLLPATTAETEGVALSDVYSEQEIGYIHKINKLIDTF